MSVVILSGVKPLWPVDTRGAYRVSESVCWGGGGVGGG